MSAAQLERIQSYLRVAAPRGREHEHLGPFLATFSPSTDNPYLNYAIPADAASPTSDEVTALVDAYRRRNRKPRLEYVASLAPDVEPALLAGGFEVEGRLPLMVYGGAAEKPVPAGIELVAARTDDELRAVAVIQWEAYGEEGPLADRAVESLRSTLASGGAVVLAREAATRDPAGGAVCTGPHGGTTELTSVAVREPFRRRGIAEAMARRLAGELQARVCDCVFLMADGAPEERIYARAGFQTISDILHISHGCRQLSCDMCRSDTLKPARKPARSATYAQAN